jgi:phosphopantothenoylcysteine decarboxylase/phosphopantothenate--cysteine ligase
LRVIVGVTGGVAAYKALSIIRELKRLGHEVRVIATESAFRFVGRDSLAALSESPVEADLFADTDQVKHIELAHWADLIVVAPATASFVSRLATGSAWDLLDNVALAASCPIMVAPAMHTEMWQNPATVANVQVIRSRGIAVLEPAEGWLSSGDYGSGRLPAPEVVVSEALNLLVEKDLNGVNAVVTAGGTIEEIDPVRFIGNLSSGRTGLAIANELHRRGAHVMLIACNLAHNLGVSYPVTSVRTSAELATALQSVQGTQLLVMAAAVSDYTLQRTDSKIPRGQGSLNLKLDPTRDLLAEFVSKNPQVLTVGFTLQDRESLRESAIRKLGSKGVSLMVANDLESLGGQQTRGFIMSSDFELEFSCTKHELAALLVKQIAKRLAVAG